VPETLMQIVESPARVVTEGEMAVYDWNGHPIDVSPARVLLVVQRFVKGRSQSRASSITESTSDPLSVRGASSRV
jgi:hypothetical protein